MFKPYLKKSFGGRWQAHYFPNITYFNLLLYSDENTSSKTVGLPPEVTSRSRDVNKDGGGVNDLTLSPHPLINMQMTQLICKYM